MKHKKTALLAAAILCLGAGVGSVFAFTPRGAQTSQQGALDKAVKLYWTNGETEVTTDPVDDLKANEDQYRYLAVEPEGSSTLQGTVTVSFELYIDTAQGYVLNGFSLEIYEIDEEDMDDTKFAAFLAGGATPLDILTSANTEAEDTIDVVDGAGSGYYGFVFKYDGSEIVDKTKWGGNLKVNQSFAETPIAG